jgi:hypothetical protein
VPRPEHKERSQLLGEFLQPVKITVTLTRADYASAMRTLMKGKFGLFGTICFAISICFLMYLAGQLYIQNPNQGRIWVTGLIAVLALYVFLLVFGPSIIARAFVRKNSHTLGPTDCTCSIEGFYMPV